MRLCAAVSHIFDCPCSDGSGDDEPLIFGADCDVAECAFVSALAGQAVHCGYSYVAASPCCSVLFSLHTQREAIGIVLLQSDEWYHGIFVPQTETSKQTMLSPTIILVPPTITFRFARERACTRLESQILLLLTKLMLLPSSCSVVFVCE